ncbi:MAG: sulfite exporter TauE/SafE family protein [Patescibacteria group bacterium]
MQTIWLAFLTGLTTGGISCLAVQGGLLVSSVSQTTETGLIDGSSSKSVSFRTIGMFLGAKLVAHTILGFLLGMIGSTLVLSPVIMGFVQIGAGLFMLVTAARIANLHPIFRYFVISPPRWAFKLLRRVSRDESAFAPLALGFFTVLMPCGVTQATMAVAVASGSPWLGAAVMGSFILGTSPIFFFLGAALMTLLKNKLFSYAAATVVAVFALYSINGGIGLTGSFYTLTNIYRAATSNVDELALAKSGSVAGVANDGLQRVTITVKSNGYTADSTTVKAGIPVKLKLISDQANGCARAFTIPGLGISKILPVNGEEELVFTPKKTGLLAYACSMGMYTGSFTVIP